VVGVNIYGSLKLGVLLGLAAGFLVSVICHFIIERLGSTGANLIYGTRRPIYSDFEKFEGPLNQARYLKQKNDYAKASNMVDDILTNAPSLPEALYLKAQILWEGYRDADSSQNCLRKILVVSPDKNGTYHRWALSLLDDIESIQDNKDKSS
jgi:tetratricopeptide (TPR) repeat protein